MTAREKLLAWRLRQGLSQREAAERAGLTKAAWQSYEAGASPKAPAIGAIEKVTGGEVVLDDWAESEEQKVVRRARAAAKRVSRKPDDPEHALPNGRLHVKAG